MRRFLSILTALLLACSPVSAQTAKALFSAKSTPSEHKPYALGQYSKGCLAGAQQLPETGPSWQAMRLSRNRNWGHPDMLQYIVRLSRKAQQIGWAGLYVGDISQPRGGPMNGGHASHQMGLDADIWLLPPRRLNLSVAERESISSLDVRSSDQRSVNGNWTRQHHELLKAAASDPAVARIFITAPVKLQMCADEKGDRTYLRKLRPWWGHNTHFHVRLNCPEGVGGCEEQDPIPAGDGCAEAVWWVTDALKPAKPDPNAPKPEPKRELTLADLPQQCRAVLNN
jgi:penicillin-insensitive murein DD-endopeptidase